MLLMNATETFAAYLSRRRTFAGQLLAIDGWHTEAKRERFSMLARCEKVNPTTLWVIDTTTGARVKLNDMGAVRLLDATISVVCV